ncbi:unnamed protein product, partial [Schistosoma curassoni]
MCFLVFLFSISLQEASGGFVSQFGDVRNVCPIHFQCLFLVSSSTESWIVLSSSRLLLMVSCQRTLRIL